MRTLAFCTSYCSTLAEWNERYRRWLVGVRQLGLADQILLVDDASPVCPGWSDLRISSGNYVTDAAVPTDPSIAILHRFPQRLGRVSSVDCAGWYRSFAFGVDYARHHGFERVIHLESDAYLISRRITDYVGTKTDGWTALWSERHQFPEITIQVAACEGLSALHEFTRRHYGDHLRGVLHEHVFPYTHVERGFTGDRLGETGAAIPRNVDFVSQIAPQRECSYYWWLPEGKRFQDGDVLENQAINIDFGVSGLSENVVREGWSHQEDRIRWMTGYHSRLQLPPMFSNGGLIVRISIHHAMHGPKRMQNLQLLLNGRVLTEFEVIGTPILGAFLPRNYLRGDGTDEITFVHPDAITPNQLYDGIDDHRLLSVAVGGIMLVPVR